MNPIDLPPAIARAFVADMRAFFAEDNVHKADEIAIRQLHALGPYYRGRKLKVSDVKRMFREMRGQI